MKKLLFLLLPAMLLLMMTSRSFAAGLALHSGTDRIFILRNISVDDTVRGDIVAISSDVEVNGAVRRDVISIFGNVSINSEVKGDVVVIYGSLNVNDNGIVHGDAISVGTFEKNGNARIYGNEINVDMSFLNLGRAALAVIVIAMGVLLFVFAFPVLAIFNRRFRTIAGTFESNTGKRIAAGFLFILAATILLPILSITVIGLFVYLLVLILAETTVCIFFGKAIIRAVSGKDNLYLDFIAGFVFSGLIKAVLLAAAPRIGVVFAAVVILLMYIFIFSFGTGILLDTRFGYSKKLM